MKPFKVLAPGTIHDAACYNIMFNAAPGTIHDAACYSIMFNAAPGTIHDAACYSIMFNAAPGTIHDAACYNIMFNAAPGTIHDAACYNIMFNAAPGTIHDAACYNIMFNAAPGTIHDAACYNIMFNAAPGTIHDAACYSIMFNAAPGTIHDAACYSIMFNAAPGTIHDAACYSIMFNAAPGTIHDAACYSIMFNAAPGGICLLMFRLYGDPFKRGFFCDDESLKHPFKDSTVTSFTLYFVGFSVPIAIMIVLEAFRIYMQKIPEQEKIVNKHGKLIVYVRNLYLSVMPFLFGAVVEQLTTDIGKYSVGRLRPHFFSVCQLEWTTISCENNSYIEDFKCLSNDQNAVREVRLSFPSGHASFSTYAAVYTVIYLQVQLKVRMQNLLKPAIQVLILYAAYYTCLSRISDYKHHWSDVLCGTVIGIVVAIIVAVHVSNLLPCNSQSSSLRADNETNNGTSDLAILTEEVRGNRDAAASVLESSEATVSARM
ncbi:hypothetical protein ACJMK2_019649 [Sinanodonta woodiana]|uniref:Phosphatidic acid phosphatase type 2/haloperoxidase domain-containing protein n=1 Tax=Sinanodonta woodiana TaxID=1069815 RepID=A0ABD3TXJ8_SINWO